MSETDTEIRGSALVVACVHKDAKMPIKATSGAAGYDLSACENKIVPAHGRALVSTGLVMAFPSAVYGQIASRSGLAYKNGIVVGAGVIDSDYRGIVGVVLFNHSDNDFQVNIGDRIAQLLVLTLALGRSVQISEAKYKECFVEDTKEGHRGAGGFGSTGVASATRSVGTAATSNTALGMATPTSPGVGNAGTQKPQVPSPTQAQGNPLKLKSMPPKTVSIKQNAFTVQKRNV